MSKQLLSDIAQDALAFIEQRKSLMISSVDSDHVPLASYAPFYRNNDGDFFVFVSTLSEHTNNLIESSVSIMLIEDENQCRQIYARKRIIFHCQTEQVSENKTAILQHLQHRHGEIIETLSSLSDFRLIKLTPDYGRLVLGFGQAYDIDRQVTEVKPVLPKKA